MNEKAQLDKLAAWMKKWLIVGKSSANIALAVAVDQLFDPQENSEVVELLKGPRPKPQSSPQCPKCQTREFKVTGDFARCSYRYCRYEGGVREFLPL